MIFELRPWEILALVGLVAYWLGWKSAMAYARLGLHKALTPAQRATMGLWIQENIEELKSGKAR